MEHFFHGSFNLTCHEGTGTVYLAIHPDMCPVDQGIKHSGNYFVYCVHPTQGSCNLMLKQDENCKWFSERKPPFFADAFVEWIGSQIELHDKHYSCHPVQ